MNLTAETLKIDTDTLKIVFGFSEVEAQAFVILSDEEKIKADFARLANRTDFVAKIAKTVIANNYTQLSAKQADIINDKSIFMYDAIYTENDHKQMEDWASSAKYRQAGSSLR